MALEIDGAESSSRWQISNKMPSFTLFSNTDIERATNGLSDSLITGRWRFGTVYRGYIDNAEVDIIMLDPKLPQDVDEFNQELNVLKALRHPNLVDLVGACIDLRAVVYKFPKRNLEDCLKRSPRLLTWQLRTRIIYQICSAFLFLYSNKPKPIIHGTLRAEHVRLDSNFNCTVLIPEGSTATNPNPRGKFTEYIETGRKVGSDVYFLGVIILSVLTGLSAPDIQRRVLYEGNWVAGNVDSVAGSWPSELVKKLAYFGSEFCNSTSCPLEEVMRKLVNILAAIYIYDFTDNKVSSSSQESYGDKLPESLQHSSREDIPEAKLHHTTSSEGRGSNEMSSIILLSNYDIENATKGLSDSLKIGQGGYGAVYRGYFGNAEVAIKLLDANSSQGIVEFLQEVEVLGRLKHPHLINLIGACFKLRSLVYEFLPNGSLRDCLRKNPRLLTWPMRTRIVHQICSALIFLHANKPEPVVHGDLKPGNILLDADFNSKLADFGLCRFIPEGTTTVAFLETKPKGTFGYVDPEFMKTGILTPGCDVYSFGVTILILLTGMDAIGISAKVRRAYKEKSLMTMVDQTAGNWPADVSEFLAYFGLRCCARNKSSGLLNDIARDLEEILAVIGPSRTA